MLKSLEHHEHAEHIAHEGEGHGAEGHGTGEHGGHISNRLAALQVAVLAACLAITEQGAKHAEIKVQERSVAAADAWAQYQAKSTRATIALDVGRVVGALDFPTREAAERRDKVIEALNKDQERYERDPKDGKEAVAERAHHYEEQRNRALEQTHAYHNGAAALELGIVLTTASAIMSSRLLIWMALGFGVAGVLFAILGYVAPEYGAL